MDNITFIEKFDQHKLNTIIKNEEYFRDIIETRKGHKLDDKYCPFKIAQTYLQNSKNGRIEVNYKQTSGRMFAKKALSLQSMPREIRNTISRDYYHDIDMVNAHPVIFEYICKKHNFDKDDYKYLSEYINNRDDKLNEISIDRSLSKKTYLSIINGGSKLYFNVKNKSRFLINFRNEIKKLHNKIITIYEDDYEKHCEDREQKGIDFNHAGSFINKMFCVIENDILHVVHDFYNNCKNVVPCFDGMMVDKEIYFNNFNLLEDIKKIEKLVFEKLNINMKFKLKEMDEYFDFEFEKIKIEEYDDSPFGIIVNKTKKPLDNIELENLKNDIVDYVNQEYCLISCGRSFYMKECIDLDCDERYFELVYKDLGSMKIDFADKDLTIKYINEKEKITNIIINVFDIWNKSPKRRKYEGIDFMPYSSLKSKRERENELSKKYKKYNLFHGLFYTCEDLENIEPLPYNDETPFFNHLKYKWCEGNEKLTNYVLDWFAHLIQKPHIKMGTALVLKSQERSGKGMIIQLIAKILGQEYFYQPTNINDVMGSFNGGLSNKLLVFLDEMCWGGDKSKAGILKKMITESKITINEKHKPVYQSNNCINTIIASNEDWIVPSGMTSTRWQVLRTNDWLALLKNEDEKVKYINNIINTDLKRLAKFFYLRDISNFRPGNIVETEALLDQKIQSMTPLNKWYLNILIDGNINNIELDKPISKNDMYDNFIKVEGGKHINKVHFWRWLKENSKYEEKQIRRIRHIQFGDINILRKDWNYKNNCNWKFEELENEDDDSIISM